MTRLRAEAKTSRPAIAAQLIEMQRGAGSAPRASIAIVVHGLRLRRLGLGFGERRSERTGIADGLRGASSQETVTKSIRNAGEYLIPRLAE